MSTTIRISEIVDKYIKAHGRFGETHDDVLRRCLKDFEFFERSTQPRECFTEMCYHTETGYAMSDGVGVLSN